MLPETLSTLLRVSRSWNAFYTCSANRVSILRQTLTHTIEESESKIESILSANHPAPLQQDLLRAYLRSYPSLVSSSLPYVLSLPYASIIEEYQPFSDDTLHSMLSTGYDISSLRIWLERLWLERMPDLTTEAIEETEKLVLRLLWQGDEELWVIQFLHGSGLIYHLDCCRLLLGYLSHYGHPDHRSYIPNKKVIAYLYLQARDKCWREGQWQLWYLLADIFKKQLTKVKSKGIEGLRQYLDRSCPLYVEDKSYSPLVEHGLVVILHLFMMGKCYIAEDIYPSLGYCFTSYEAESYINAYVSQGPRLSFNLSFVTLKYLIVLSRQSVYYYIQADSLEFLQGVIVALGLAKIEATITSYDCRNEVAIQSI